MTLEQLLQPIGIETFFNDYWEQRCLHLERHSQDYYKNLLTLNDVDAYFQNKQLPAQYIRVAKSEESFRSEQWSKLETRRDFNSLHLVDHERLFNLFDNGASIILGSAEERLSPLGEFCSRLSQELKFRVQANLYITPPNSQGLNHHFDTHDVLVLQISGTKTWAIYDRPVDNPVLEQDFQAADYKKAKPTKSLTLNAGDLLYIPRGFIHEADTHDSSSVHITLGLHSTRGVDIFEMLSSKAMESAFFRASTPSAQSSKEQKAQYAQHLREQLDKLIESNDFLSLLNEHENSFLNGVALPSQGQFADRIESGQLTLDSIVRKKHDVIYQQQQIDDHIRVSINKNSVNVPAYLQATLDELLNESPFAVGSLQGLLSDQGKVHLVRQFIQLGLLKIETC